MLPQYSHRERYLLQQQRRYYYVDAVEMTLEQLHNYLSIAATLALQHPQGRMWCRKRFSPKMVACCKKWLSAAKSGENVPQLGDTVLLLPLCTPKRGKIPPEAALFENFRLFFTVAGSEWPQRQQPF